MLTRLTAPIADRVTIDIVDNSVVVHHREYDECACNYWAIDLVNVDAAGNVSKAIRHLLEAGITDLGLEVVMEKLKTHMPYPED